MCSLPQKALKIPKIPTSLARHFQKLDQAGLRLVERIDCNPFWKSKLELLDKVKPYQRVLIMIALVLGPPGGIPVTVTWFYLTYARRKNRKSMPPTDN